MIKIICFDISEITDEKFDYLYSISNVERKEKSDKYKQVTDKIRCISAGILLKYALNEWIEQSQPLLNNEASLVFSEKIKKNTHGKPYIENIDNFFFNVSHSGKWVILAYGEYEIGTDIEEIQTFNQESKEKLAKRFFTKDELRYLYEKDVFSFEKFYETWTGKEAYLKYIGVGISHGLDSVDTIALKSEGLTGCIFEYNYYLSTFSTDKEHEIKILSYDDIISKLTYNIY